MTTYRTDRNNNPTAMIVQMAAEGGLVEGTDYVQGDAFLIGDSTYWTAKLLGDPIESTIKVIDKLGFYTVAPHQRWTYIGIPYQVWLSFTREQKVATIGFMYGQEGGEDLKGLFA